MMKSKDARFQVERTVLEPAKFDRSELMTMSEAAKMLGYASLHSVRMHVDTGNLDAVIDTEAAQAQGRRLVVRSQVIELGERLGRDINIGVLQPA